MGSLSISIVAIVISLLMQNCYRKKKRESEQREQSRQNLIMCLYNGAGRVHSTHLKAMNIINKTPRTVMTSTAVKISIW